MIELAVGIIALMVLGVTLGVLLHRHRYSLGIGGKGSASARLAEHDTKITTLKTAVANKKDEALDVHKALDEVDSLLG